MRTEALKKAQAKYDSTSTTIITLKLNNKTDSDIIEYLSRSGNKQGAIKSIIREYLEGRSQ